MYRLIIRPLLFRLPPEKVHHMTVAALRVVRHIPFGNAVMRLLYRTGTKYETEVFGLKFHNPIGLAAGFDKNAEVYNQLDNLGFGFVEIGTVTPKAQPGNSKPRLFRLPADKALINRMGFNNNGLEKAVANMRRKGKKTIIGASIGKNTLTPNENAPADYLRSFRSLYQYADYFVLNVSCPNVANVTALQNRDNIIAIVKGLLEFRRGQNQYRPLLLKISPDLTYAQVDDIIDVVREFSLDGIVAVNTTTSREGLKTDSGVVEAMGNGGLSGGPLTERALDMVRYIYNRTEGCFPIIGVGGVMTPADARDMLRAGASLVQVYTGLVYEGPSFVKRICRYLRNHNE